MKAFYPIKPQSIHSLPSGDVAVCIDWAEKTAHWKVGDVQGWECRRVDIPRAQLTADIAIEKLIRDRYTQSEEFALINAYQASVSGIANDPEKEQEYLDFLAWRKGVKEQVKAMMPEFLVNNPYDESQEPQLPI